MNALTKIASWHLTEEARAILARIEPAALAYRPHPLEPGVPQFIGLGDWIGTSPRACFGCGECGACRNGVAIDHLASLRRAAVEEESGIIPGPDTTTAEMERYLAASRMVPTLTDVLLPVSRGV